MRDVFISTSVVDIMQACWRKYHLQKKRRLTTFRKPERMEKGTVGHAYLAHYYREIGLNTTREQKVSLASIQEGARFMGTNVSLETDLRPDAIDRVLDLCDLYVDHYSGDGWTPMLDDKGQPLVEVPITKLLYTRPDTEEGEGVRVIYNGIIDLILPPRKGVPVTVVDHKFKDRFSELVPLDNQLSLYAGVTGIPDVIRNDIGGQKEGNPNKFRRQSYKYQRSQMEENVRWAVYWALEADYHETVDIWPPNPTSCDKYGGCVFVPVCSTIPDGREGVINANFKVGEFFSLYRPESRVEGATPKTEAPPVVEAADATVPALRGDEREVPLDHEGTRNDPGQEAVSVVSEAVPVRDVVQHESGKAVPSSLPDIVQQILAGKK